MRLPSLRSNLELVAKFRGSSETVRRGAESTETKGVSMLILRRWWSFLKKKQKVQEQTRKIIKGSSPFDKTLGPRSVQKQPHSDIVAAGQELIGVWIGSYDIYFQPTICNINLK